MHGLGLATTGAGLFSIWAYSARNFAASSGWCNASYSAAKSLRAACRNPIEGLACLPSIWYPARVSTKDS
jgi:hypothetical protein